MEVKKILLTPMRTALANISGSHLKCGKGVYPMAEMRFCPECGRPLKPKRLALILLVIIILVSNLTWLWFYEDLRASSEAESLILRMELEEAGARNENLEARILTVEAEISNLKTKLANQNLSRFKLREPTLKELEDFLAIDATSEREWVEGEYECEKFA